MADSTVYLSGLASSLDWRNLIDQLMAVEKKPVELMQSDKDKLSSKYDAWGDVNTKLISLKSAVGSLSELDDFDVFTSNMSASGTTSDASDFMDVGVGSNASEGTYTIEIDSLAQAQKLSTKSFESIGSGLGITGDLLINGRVLSLSSTDTLSDIKNKINALNSGDNPAEVTASIITVADGEYRLTLTSQDTGADGIDIANASATDLLTQLGISDDTTTVANPITGGARSRAFTSSTQDIKDLIGLSTTQSGNVTIEGETISIDLSTDSLQSIRDKINSNTNLQTKGVSASVVSDTESGTTTYTLQIDGSQTFVDASNILETLGFIEQGHSDVYGVTGSTANTANGSTITSDSLITDIDGYNTFTSGDKITISGTDHDGNAITSTDLSITSSSTVGDLLSAIESAYGGNVTAYVNSDGKIVVEDNQSGTSSLSLSLTSAIADSNSTLDFGTFSLSSVRKREIIAGQDAAIKVDGITMTRSSNQITDIIPGVTLDLRDADSSVTITLNINRDYDSIKSKIQDFVDKYNDVITYINSQFDYNENDSSSTPVLFGDSSLLTVKSDIRDVILSSVTGLGSDFDHLSLIGINIDTDGKLSIDDSKLDGYLRTNFSDVKSLFAAQGSSTNGNLTYVNSTRDSTAGSYNVEITQPATRATTTGSGFSGTLSSDVTITITDDQSRVAKVSLSAGWNITSIVNAINSEFSQEYNEIRVGDNSYYSDAGATTPITDSTAWDSVYDSSGSSAGLTSGDTISFSGTNRSGIAVSGNYTIDDPSTDTVGDLLDEIESAFGTGYDAYIDSQGRIAIKDTTAGDSNLTLAIGSVKNLDFGTIDVDPTGADGSQEGRYSMDITALNSDGQLSIRNNAYGGSSFTVSVSGGNLGITDGTYTGQDVAGRIQTSGSSTWMTMTGSGQTLTGDDDQAVEGLVIKYTGTTTGTFDFTFTTGVGEELDRTLYYMTDPYSGYVAGKQDALKDQMDNMDQRIEAANKRLDTRREILINQFVEMEKALSQLQAQQQWLSSQISSLG